MEAWFSRLLQLDQRLGPIRCFSYPRDLGSIRPTSGIDKASAHSNEPLFQVGDFWELWDDHLVRFMNLSYYYLVVAYGLLSPKRIPGNAFAFRVLVDELYHFPFAAEELQEWHRVERTR